MTIYLYEGVDKDGKEVSGELKVVSRDSLLNIPSIECILFSG